MWRLCVDKEQHGVWRGVMRATMFCKQLWTMHVGWVVLIVSLFSLINSVFSQTPSKLTLPTPSTAFTSEKPELPVHVIFLAPPPLPQPIPVCITLFFALITLFLLCFFFSHSVLCVNAFFFYCLCCVVSISSHFFIIFCGFVTGYGSCVYPSTIRYAHFLHTLF